MTDITRREAEAMSRSDTIASVPAALRAIAAA